MGHDTYDRYKWQPHVTGVIERTLYILSFLGGEPGFIVFWLGYKVAVRWRVWTKDKEEENDEHKGRATFSNHFNGSALSILYAVVGYIIASYWDAISAIIGFILILLTLLLFQILKKVQSQESEKHDVHEKL
ncbi:hypothetical protein ACFL0H_13430 [Thermodesulfobacteriota bacterium]